ncbi:MAG: TolB family protein [Candidatus Eiseniibacteriota bacterium]
MCLTLFAISATTLLTGCDKTPAPTAPTGDTGGVHLLVFSSDRNQTAGQFDIYLFDMDAGGYRLIQNISSPTVPDLRPTISPDGLFIAFQTNRGTGTGSDIYVYSRAAQDTITVKGINTAADETDPAFTGDALKLAFTQKAANGFTRIRMYDARGDTLMKLPGLDTTATFNDYSPSPSLDGSRIAFVSDRGGSPDIFVWDRASHALLSLPNLNSAGNDVDPYMTFDSRWLAFASDRSGGIGGYDLYLYDTLGLAYVTLPASAQTTADERHPALTQSGTSLVFQSQRPGLGGWDLFFCNISGASVGPLSAASSSKDDIDPYLLYP